MCRSMRENWPTRDAGPNGKHEEDVGSLWAQTGSQLTVEKTGRTSRRPLQGAVSASALPGQQAGLSPVPPAGNLQPSQNQQKISSLIPAVQTGPTDPGRFKAKQHVGDASVLVVCCHEWAQSFPILTPRGESWAGRAWALSPPSSPLHKCGPFASSAKCPLTLTAPLGLAETSRCIDRLEGDAGNRNGLGLA